MNGFVPSGWSKGSAVAMLAAMVLAGAAGMRAVPAAASPGDPSGQGPSEKPPWAGSTAGLSDEVLPPWTPIEATENHVRVWGRTYTFTGLPLPSGVVTRDAEVLAGPIRLTGSADAKPLAWRGSSCRLLQRQPHLATLSARAESGPLICEGTVRVEFDGMVRCDVRLLPRLAGSKVTIQRLALEIPVRPQHAAYLHTWPGQWGSAANSRALPAEGYRGPLKPFVWLGDTLRGLAWFTESDRNFFNAQADRVLEIQREQSATVVRVNLITAPQTIDAPLDYTFGFQATPVKPARPDAWDYRTVHMGSYGLDEQTHTLPDGKKVPLLDHLAARGVRTICFHEHWSDIQNYPKAAQPEALHRLVRACHDRKIQLLLYFGYEMSTIAPEWGRYHEECLVHPRAGGYKRKPEQTAYIVCYRSHWQDFLAQGIDRILEEFKIDGVYLDGTSEPWGCANLRHGCGYKRPDGSVGTTYPFFATRQMMKRIYTIVKRRNPEGQLNVHQSTCMTIPTLAFATSYWDGEQLQSVKRKTSVLEVLPLDAFCAEFMGHNWGVPAELLWYSSGPFRRHEADTLALLHDIPTRPSSLADLEVYSRLWRAHDAFGRHQATWIPYWESGKVARASDPNMKVSLHNRPRQGLLAVIANTGPQPCQAAVSLDLQTLGQPPGLVARDILADKDLRLADGQILVSLAPLEHVVVWLKPR
ncbi:MAG: glycoside hydrolase domain-containing protein [Thermoguttaceae bacterium]